MTHYHNQELVKSTVEKIKADEAYKADGEAIKKDIKRMRASAKYEYDEVMRNPYRAPELEEEAEQTLAWYNDLLAGLED